ncbi:hypothetical protein KBD59_00245 [Candidatus Gracilibacteria bacterium]|nr:hypothetical protein [Candidatus Gracilibacteria bacterium]
MKKTMTVFSALMLIALLSACGTTPTATVTTDTTQSNDSVQTTTVKEGTSPEVTAEEKSPSVDEGDLYFKVLASGDVKQCDKLTTVFLKSQCTSKLTAKEE